ncbi:MAG TPA: SDR family NAD(P)-dependent oxidoreductase [Polyangiaceae bacterium]|nr:SDR family NAD(P)-dependent oxidoreductase [Polyangiaceae bacterium]
MSSLAGRRILITGVSRGIGLETARLFLSQGAEIIGTARDATRLEAARRALDPSGARLSVVAADLGHSSAPALLHEAVRRRWGALDVLFNNAGVQQDGVARGFEDGKESVLEHALSVNLLAPYRSCLALLPMLRAGREPRIVNVSSGAANMASMRSSGIASYRLSKWALNGFTLLLATELSGQVAVNAFDPGWVKTDLGGEQAPGLPIESARGALALVTLPFAETGKFWKDGAEIPF